MTKTWKARKLHDLDIRFGTSYRDFKEGGYVDDRRVFVNTYEIIVQALESLPEEPVSYIRVAMWRQINRDYKMMDEILAKFTD